MMRWVSVIDLPVTPAHAFTVVRHFHRVYHRLHEAHLPPPPGEVPGLLAAGYRFALEEAFGPEHRRYELAVEAFEPERGRVLVAGTSLTRSGRLAVHGLLEIEFVVEPRAEGSRLVVTQRARFANPWLDRLLGHTWLWPSAARHVQEEARHTLAFMTDPTLLEDGERSA